MKYITLIPFICLIFSYLEAQNTHQEQVYLHLNSADVIVGENLHFSAFSYSQKSRNLSKLSCLVYVELLNQKGSPAIQTKVKLENGRGAGSFFLPADLPTGTYHLVAYTRWMRNFEAYFHTPITVINPYKKPNKSLITNDLKVNFYPESGQVLQNTSNQILISVQNYQTQKIHGKIINNINDVVLSNLNFDEFGFCRINLNYDSAVNYRLMLDYQHNFQFFDLPKAEKASKITVVEKENTFEIQLQNQSKKTTGELELFASNQTLKTLKTDLNATHQISKNDLPNGLLGVRLNVDNQIENERLFWHSDLETHQKILPEKSKTSLVKFELDIPKDATISVSIKRAYGNNIAPSWQDYLWLSELETDLNLSKIRKYDKVLIDNILIASRHHKRINTLSKIKHYPEYQYGVIQGQIVAWQPHKPTAIALSFKDIQTGIVASAIDLSGQFYIRYDPDFASEEAIISVMDSSNYSSRIKIEPEFYSNYSDLPNLPLFLDSVSIMQIIERSTNNQIQNAYYQADKIEKGTIFSDKISGFTTYFLDDFTRFPSIRDTFIEYVLEVSVSKNKRNFDLKINSKNIDYTDKIDAPVLLLIDGILTDSEQILTIPSASVKRIDVLNERFFMDGILFNGILSLTTFQKNALNIRPLGETLKLTSIQNRLSEIIVTSIKNKRTPCRQDLLYWNPNIRTQTDKTLLQFETSEVAGKYEIRVEGTTENGQIVSQSYWFTVK